MTRLVWKTMSSALLAAGLMGLQAPDARAQTVLDGYWGGINAGAGLVNVTCSESDGCEEGFQSGLSWGLQGGGPLSRSVHWSIEASGYYSPDDGGDPWLMALSGLARWSPVSGSGFFVKGGGGWSWYKGLVPVGDTPPSGNAFQVEVGTGWDFGTAQGLAFAPYLDLILAPSAPISNDGLNPIDGAKIYVIQLGISILRP